jgi:hypothetical protein
MTVSLPCLEVSALGARVLSVSAAAVFTAAVVFYGLLRGRERRLRREAVSQRLVAGCTARDVVALRDQLEVFRVRLSQEVAPPWSTGPTGGPTAGSAAGPVVAGVGADGDPSVPRFPVDVSSEGGAP